MSSGAIWCRDAWMLYWQAIVTRCKKRDVRMINSDMWNYQRQTLVDASDGDDVIGVISSLSVVTGEHILSNGGLLEQVNNLQHYPSVDQNKDDQPPQEVIEASQKQNPTGSFIKLAHVEYSPFHDSPIQTYPVGEMFFSWVLILV
ncbi:uncharacterized protein F5891DRAFT_974008 [Suillus fuscotomentosus]|uniref:Uncharacterized protein n=1 Tax=Suillus fuscotomentosus TaxID=1912939 RepID=A0AAD4EQ89_9AGAM|nr:uncharacterized protein F5891DRAFT_974008 [Suillus fuscotomentosus]KAG1908659.1 hypothetical protein F5891DRAFT_974008 [Suillus fuscotomentosus]